METSEKQCYPRLGSFSSSGVWLNSSPMQSYLPILMTQMIIVVVFSRAIHAALRPLGQSIIVSQILTGILLSPTALGRLPFLKELFQPSKTSVLKVLGIIGLCLFQFMIGVKIDFGMLTKSGKKAISVGVVGHIVPSILTACVFYFSNTSMNFDQVRNEVLIWSMSSIVVVAYLLDELNLLNSKIGRLAIAASLIETTIDAFYRRIVTVYFLQSLAKSAVTAWVSLLAFVGYIAVIVFVARPITKRIVKRTPEGEPLSEGSLAFILVMVLGLGLVSTLIGHDMSLGVFFVGLALPSGPPLGSTLVEKLEGIISALFFPVFVAIIGLEVDLTRVVAFARALKPMIFFDVVTVVGKTIGVMAAAFFSRMSFHKNLTLVFIMNAKGITELVHLHSWQDIKYLNISYYTVILLEILAAAAVAGPLVKFMYDPSKRYYSGHKRRTVMHGKSNAELRVISCIHTQDHVPPAVNLLESLCVDSQQPLSINLVHLTELVGSVSSVLAPYRQGKSDCYSTPASDTIVNAFWAFEQKKNPRSISVQPYINVAPYVSMYDDICDLALEKKASMIFLPFHRTVLSSTVESTSEEQREVNLSVLRYAPCSVAVLIDHGNITDIDVALANLIRSVVVYFIGGPDDREALALAIRMGHNSRVNITVFHFRPKDEEIVDMGSENQDSDMIYEFKTNFRERSDMIYREEFVKDGEGMVDIIRMTVRSFDIIIVGRRVVGGQESLLTQGMSVWSEFPELGCVGDMLASKDLGCHITTLVVQQQQHIRQ